MAVSTLGTKDEWPELDTMLHEFQVLNWLHALMQKYQHDYDTEPDRPGAWKVTTHVTKVMTAREVKVACVPALVQKRIKAALKLKLFEEIV